MIIIVWAFIYEINILPSITLAGLFLIQQLIYKIKIEKHNVSLDIFVSDISIARNLDLPRLEKKYFSYIKTHTHFLDQILVFVLLKIKERWRIRAFS